MHLILSQEESRVAEMAAFLSKEKEKLSWLIHINRYANLKEH
jgi:hypothetical protein